MTILYYQDMLRSISSTDPSVLTAAALADQYAEMFTSNKISSTAFYELLQNLQVQTAIDYELSDPYSFELLNTALTGLSVISVEN